MVDAMIKIKLTHGTHTVLSTGKSYSAGDVFEGTESMLKGLSGKAELYDIQANNVGLEEEALIVELRRDLEEHGVSYHANAGVKRLREQLDEALANADSDA